MRNPASSRQRMRWALLGSIFVEVGCQASSSTQTRTKAANQANLVSAVHMGDDAARCEFKGRSDRDVEESATVGSIKPNIRRVYAMVG